MLIERIARRMDPQAFRAFDKHGRKTNAMQYALLQARIALETVADWLDESEATPRAKPTIEELERLLAAESTAQISLNPDGSIRVGPSRTVELMRAQLAEPLSSPAHFAE